MITNLLEADFVRVDAVWCELQSQCEVWRSTIIVRLVECVRCEY